MGGADGQRKLKLTGFWGGLVPRIGHRVGYTGLGHTLAEQQFGRSESDETNGRRALRTCSRIGGSLVHVDTSAIKRIGVVSFRGEYGTLQGQHALLLW